MCVNCWFLVQLYRAKIYMYVRVTSRIYLLVTRTELDWEKTFVHLGLYCESRLDHCEGSPCLNGGQCNNHLTNFTCTCAAGFTGMWKSILKQPNSLLNVSKYGNLN